MSNDYSLEICQLGKELDEQLRSVEDHFSATYPGVEATVGVSLPKAELFGFRRLGKGWRLATTISGRPNEWFPLLERSLECKASVCPWLAVLQRQLACGTRKLMGDLKEAISSAQYELKTKASGLRELPGETESVACGCPGPLFGEHHNLGCSMRVSCTCNGNSNRRSIEGDKYHTEHCQLHSNQTSKMKASTNA